MPENRFNFLNSKSTHKHVMKCSVNEGCGFHDPAFLLECRTRNKSEDAEIYLWMRKVIPYRKDHQIDIDYISIPHECVGSMSSRYGSLQSALLNWIVSTALKLQYQYDPSTIFMTQSYKNFRLSNALLGTRRHVDKMHSLVLSLTAQSSSQFTVRQNEPRV